MLVSVDVSFNQVGGSFLLMFFWASPLENINTCFFPSFVVIINLLPINGGGTLVQYNNPILPSTPQNTIIFYIITYFKLKWNAY